MTYRIGIIGSGSITSSHSYAFDRLNELYGDVKVEKVVMCSPHVTEDRAKELGWSEICHDWREVVSREDVDVIDVCAWDHLHYDVSIAAIKNGKMLICEKPLASTYEQATHLAVLAEKNNVPATVCTNYRYIHSLRCMKHLIDSGELGEIRHVYGSFKMGWAIDVNGFMNWRLDERYSPLGTLGDLGTHLIDLCRVMGLEFEKVCGVDVNFAEERFDGERMTATNSCELSAFCARFTCSALGIFELSRVTMGGGGMKLEIHGTRGSVRFDKGDINSLDVVLPERYPDMWDYKRIPAEDIIPFDYKWNDGFKQKDSYTLLFHDFLTQNGNAPTLADGAECSRIIDAVLASDK